MKLFEAAKVSNGEMVDNPTLKKSFRVVAGCLQTMDNITLGEYDHPDWHVRKAVARNNAVTI